MEPIHQTHQKLLYQGALFVLLLGVCALFIFLTPEKKNNVVVEGPSTEEIITTPNPFDSVFIEAKAAYVLDASTGEVLYQKNPELQLPLASVTKVMVALTAKKTLPEYTLVSISKDDLLEEGDSGLLVGEKWKLRNLLDFALVVSSNDAIRSIASIAGTELSLSRTTQPAEDYFIQAMNKTAREIGLTQSYFLNGSGLDLSGELSGGYGSAQDMAKLFSYVLNEHPTLLEATRYSNIAISSDSAVHNAQNTNKVLDSIPSVIASKTGFTDLSGGNLVVVFNAGIMKPIVIALLGSSREGRFNDMQALVNATIQKMAQ